MRTTTPFSASGDESSEQHILPLLVSRYIKIGDKECEFNPSFRLLLHTKLASPHYQPELQAQCTLINFTVTRDGLEEQLLAAVVSMERPDLETLKVRGGGVGEEEEEQEEEEEEQDEEDQAGRTTQTLRFLPVSDSRTPAPPPPLTSPLHSIMSSQAKVKKDKEIIAEYETQVKGG